MIGERIAKAEIMLVPSHVSVSNSNWVIWEINKAIKVKVPLIGITPYGASKTSIEVQKKANEIVGWNTESVVKAIRKHAKSSS